MSLRAVHEMQIEIERLEKRKEAAEAEKSLEQQRALVEREKVAAQAKEIEELKAAIDGIKHDKLLSTAQASQLSELAAEIQSLKHAKAKTDNANDELVGDIERLRRESALATSRHAEEIAKIGAETDSLRLFKTQVAQQAEEISNYTMEVEALKKEHRKAIDEKLQLEVDLETAMVAKTREGFLSTENSKYKEDLNLLRLEKAKAMEDMSKLAQELEVAKIHKAREAFTSEENDQLRKELDAMRAEKFKVLEDLSKAAQEVESSRLYKSKAVAQADELQKLGQELEGLRRDKAKASAQLDDLVILTSENERLKTRVQEMSNELEELRPEAAKAARLRVENETLLKECSGQEVAAASFSAAQVTEMDDMALELAKLKTEKSLAAARAEEIEKLTIELSRANLEIKRYKEKEQEQEAGAPDPISSVASGWDVLSGSVGKIQSPKAVEKAPVVVEEEEPGWTTYLSDAMDALSGESDEQRKTIVRLQAKLYEFQKDSGALFKIAAQKAMAAIARRTEKAMKTRALTGWKHICQEGAVTAAMHENLIQVKLKAEMRDDLDFLFNTWRAYVQEQLEELRKAELQDADNEKQQQAALKAAMRLAGGNDKAIVAGVFTEWKRVLAQEKMKKKAAKAGMALIGKNEQALLGMVLVEWITAYKDAKADKLQELLEAEKEAQRQRSLKAAMAMAGGNEKAILAGVVSEWKDVANSAKMKRKAGAAGQALIGKNENMQKELAFEAWLEIMKEGREERLALQRAAEKEAQLRAMQKKSNLQLLMSQSKHRELVLSVYVLLKWSFVCELKHHTKELQQKFASMLMETERKL
eukprot:TRINITY_DN12624_c4_g1_i1.p1 TRINITY_DN12624_c4_g1~~TRINITY_DN12624_c4_g1_i1.p1  ORF type:complete len:843 (+),score=273.37 TRINITY_DN12624_c4_g1_i1:78-2531(+)